MNNQNDIDRLAERIDRLAEIQTNQWHSLVARLDEQARHIDALVKRLDATRTRALACEVLLKEAKLNAGNPVTAVALEQNGRLWRVAMTLADGTEVHYAYAYNG